MTSSAVTIDRLIGTTSELYSLPAVAVEVLELTSDPKADARSLKECIEKDPALTTKILRVVNSSLFGLSQPVGDLNQALALLGMKPLKLLVLGFSLPDTLFHQVGSDVLSRYWQRTLIKAIAAREICTRAHSGMGDEAFIAGLLQDIGLLVLVQYVGAPYIRFLNKVYSAHGDLKQLEYLSIGFDHTQISAGLLRYWRLPSTIVDAVTGSHAAAHSSAETNPLPRVLDLAELVSELLCDGKSTLLPRIVENASAAPISWLDELIETLQDRVVQLADSLSLELPAPTSYRDILDRARRQMALAAEDLIGSMAHVRRATSGLADQDAVVEARLLEETQALSAAFASASHRGPMPPTSTSSKSAMLTTASSPPRAAELHASATDTGEDDTLLENCLKSHVATCRQSRVPLGLLLVEIDCFEDVVFREGRPAATTLFERLDAECQEIDHEGMVCLQTREDRFAVVLPDCDRSHLVRVGNQLITAVRGFKLSKKGDGRPAMTISVGASSVAVPPRNFPAADLLRSADRCLYAARASGGDVLKSIEIY